MGESTQKSPLDGTGPQGSMLPPAGASYTRQQRIILTAVLACQFFAGTSYSLPAPFLPKINELHGVNSNITGWIIGVSALVTLVLAPLCGKMVPHTGLHTMTVFGLFFVGGATALFGALEYLPVRENTETPDILYLSIAFILRIAHAVGNTAFSTAILTVLLVIFPKNSTTVMSYAETVVGIGAMAGPAIGGAFFKIGGFMGTFGAIGGIVIFCSVLMYFLLPHNVGTEGDEALEPVSTCELLSNVNVIYGLILVAFNSALWTCIDPILEPELRNKFGLSQELSALAFLLLTGTFIIMAPAVAKTLDKIKCLDNVYVMMFGYTVLFVNFMLIGPSPLTPWLHRPLWLLLTCLGVSGVGLGFTIVPTMALFFNGSSSDNANDREADGTEAQVNKTSTHAMLSSFWASSFALGDLVGPVISGAVTQKTNFGWTMTVWALSSASILFSLIPLKIYQAREGCCGCSFTALSKDEDEHSPLIK